MFIPIIYYKIKKMKKIIGSLLCVGLLSVAAVKAQNFTISGKIKGIQSGELIALAKVDGRMDTLGRSKFTEGNFTFKGNTKEAVFSLLAVDGYNGGFYFFAEPGATYDAYLVDGKDAYIRGGAMQDVWLKYNSTILAYNQRSRAYAKQIDSLTQANKYKSVSDLNKKVLAYRVEIQDKLKAITDLYKDEELTSYLALVESEKYDQVELKKPILTALSAKAQKTPSGRTLARQVEVLESAKVGKTAYTFTLPDENGKERSLKSIKGKVKIIDFWASWCGPCRLNNPDLVKLYNAYKDKGLEIIGVSLDEKKPNWIEAIKKDGLPWVHLSSLKGWKCEVAQGYGINSVPAVFVLNENDQIIATDLRGKALKDFIAKQLD